MGKKQVVFYNYGNTRLTRDEKQWILQELVEGKVSPKTGIKNPNSWVNVGYYGHLEHVIKDILRNKTKVPNGELAEQLKALHVELRRIQKELTEQLRKVVMEE